MVGPLYHSAWTLFTRYAPHARQHSAWRSPRQQHRARNQKSKTAAPRGRPLRSALPSRIFDSGNGSASSWSSVFSAFRTAVGAVGSLLADHPWMAEEIMKPLLQFSSFRVGHSSGLAVLDPFDTLLDHRTTPRPRRSMTPSAWWSTLRNWSGGFTRMMIKLQGLDCFLL